MEADGGGAGAHGGEDTAAVVALTFHWHCSLVPEMDWAFRHYDAALPALVAAAEVRGWELLGHGHPRAYGALVRRWKALGIEAVPSFADILDRASVLCGDNTSALPEFASVGKPVVWLSAPWYRRDVDHGSRFWTWPAGQVCVDEPEDLVSGIERALADPPEVQAAREAMVRSVYAFTDGHAAERAAAAIVERLGQPVGTSGKPRLAQERQAPVLPGG